MNEKWNINVVLCQYCDEKTGTIQQIFNNIKLGKDVTPPFYIVTFINGINVGEQLELFYCIDKVEDGSKIKRAHGGRVRLERNGKKARYPDGTYKKSSVERCYIDMVSNRINGIRFPEIGAYELKVYGFTNAEEINKLESMDDKEKDNMFTNERLFATYPFEVTV
jgi:hypothetical protein